MNTPHSDIFARYVNSLFEKVVSAIGRDAIRSVFVGGSAASGELSFCKIGNQLEIYSDVDLYVVLTEDAALDRARSAARAAAVDYPTTGEKYTFFRKPDVGVYSYQDLMAQKARPGTVDIATNYRVLYGDPALPAETAKYIDRNIHPTEALYLIENRLNELAEYRRQAVRADDTDAADRFTAFLVCKTCADVVTAELIAHGRYQPRRRDRKHVFDSLFAGGTLDGRFDADQLELIEQCHSALENLPAPISIAKGSLSDTIPAAVSLALDEWKRIATDCLAGDSRDWSSLISRRCKAGGYVSNFRQFVVLGRRCGIKRLAAMAAGTRVARYSARDALRLTALMEYLLDSATEVSGTGDLRRTVWPFLDRLTRSCGFTQGSLAERSREMHRAIQ